MPEKTINSSDENIAARISQIDVLVKKLDTDAVALLLTDFGNGSGRLGQYHSLLAGSDVGDFTPSVLQTSFKTLAGGVVTKVHEMRQGLARAKLNIQLAQADLDTANQQATNGAATAF